MASGPEHYSKAEQLLRNAPNVPDVSRMDYLVMVAAAQVHATLALAAALGTAPPPVEATDG